jgi:choline kinase
MDVKDLNINVLHSVLNSEDLDDYSNEVICKVMADKFIMLNAMRRFFFYRLEIYKLYMCYPESVMMKTRITKVYSNGKWVDVDGPWELAVYSLYRLPKPQEAIQSTH